MKERLKEARKASEHGYNQQEFAEYMNLSLSAIASYESGRRVPTPAIIALYSQKCRVSEEWLKSGEGEMRNNQSKNDVIAKIASDLFHSNESSFRYRLITGLAQLTDEQLDLLEEIVNSIADKKEG